MSWLYLAALIAGALMFKYLRFLGWIVMADVFPALGKRLKRPKKEHTADAKAHARAIPREFKNQT